MEGSAVVGSGRSIGGITRMMGLSPQAGLVGLPSGGEDGPPGG